MNFVLSCAWQLCLKNKRRDEMRYRLAVSGAISCSQRNFSKIDGWTIMGKRVVGSKTVLPVVNTHMYQYRTHLIDKFCSLAVLDPRVGHTMDVLSPFIPVLGVLSTPWCCPSRPCVVFLACVHLALFLALSLSPANSVVSSWCDHSMIASLLWGCLAVPSLLQFC